MILFPHRQFHVDVWLCYGSFFYGFESFIYDAEERSIKIVPKINEEENPDDFASFMQAIIDKPKGLVKVELRLYCPPKVEKRFKFSNPLHLYSDAIPNISGHDCGMPIVDFAFPKGMSSRCSDLWTSLLATFFKVS